MAGHLDSPLLGMSQTLGLGQTSGLGHYPKTNAKTMFSCCRDLGRSVPWPSRLGGEWSR